MQNFKRYISRNKGVLFIPPGRSIKFSLCTFFCKMKQQKFTLAKYLPSRKEYSYFLSFTWNLNLYIYPRSTHSSVRIMLLYSIWNFSPVLFNYESQLRSHCFIQNKMFPRAFTCKNKYKLARFSMFEIVLFWRWFTSLLTALIATSQGERTKGN